MTCKGATRFADLGMERLEIACAKCGRHGYYAVNMLIVAHGPAYRLSDFLADVAASCPKRHGAGTADACAVGFPQFTKE